ncbi:hypothetical protein, partial [Modestobacter roseus]
MTAVTDQDHTEHSDQPDDDAHKPDVRKPDPGKARRAFARSAGGREAEARKAGTGAAHDSSRGASDGERAPRTDSTEAAWDDGLIARRVNETAEGDRFPMTDNRSAAPQTVT